MDREELRMIKKKQREQALHINDLELKREKEYESEQVLKKEKSIERLKLRVGGETKSNEGYKSNTSAALQSR